MKHWSVWAVLLAALVALLLRVPDLDTRPLHNDEAVNAFKVRDLWTEGHYAYDPDEYHGPTLHYFSAPLLWLSRNHEPQQWTEATLRYLTVIFGVGLVLLPLLFAGGTGRQTTVWSAFFIALSPAMVFYSRYFIHEILLVFFTGLTLGSFWRYSQTGAARWAALTGAGLGLMWATKETFVLTVAAISLALALTAWLLPGSRRLPTGCQIRHLWLGAGMTGLIWLLFFSSFFTHFQGLPDSILTYLPWLKRAGGDSPHNHEWSFYLERLGWFQTGNGPVWSEGMILALALVGGVSGLVRRKSSLTCFLTFYTIILTAIYSIISYKTPWCILSFLLGMILLAGIGATEIIQFIKNNKGKWAGAVFIALLSLHLGWQAWRGAIEYASNRFNPYVYAQTSPDILKLIERVEGIGRVAPDGLKTVIKVMALDNDYWPLPWYLREYERVGYFPAIPEDPYASMMIVSSAFNARFDDDSDREWVMVGINELRPGVFFELYVNLELWKMYVETLPRPTD